MDQAATSEEAEGETARPRRPTTAQGDRRNSRAAWAAAAPCSAWAARTSDRGEPSADDSEP